MQMMIYLNVAEEKELELKRSGQRRTRRWIGDRPRYADPGWHKAKMIQVPAPVYRPNGSRQIGMCTPSGEMRTSFLNRFFQMPIIRRQAVKTKPDSHQQHKIADRIKAGMYPILSKEISTWMLGNLFWYSPNLHF